MKAKKIKKKETLVIFSIISYKTRLRVADPAFLLDTYYQDGVKSTVSRMFEDLNTKIHGGAEYKGWSTS